MQERKRQNRVRIGKSKAEEWFAAKLTSSGERWTRQAQWGYRLFDFWCARLGVAIEVDGAEHRAAIDRYRDAYNFQRSGIVVLRIPNFDEKAAEAVLAKVAAEVAWSERRNALGLHGRGKRAARSAWENAATIEELFV